MRESSIRSKNHDVMKVRAGLAQFPRVPVWVWANLMSVSEHAITKVKNGIPPDQEFMTKFDYAFRRMHQIIDAIEASSYTTVELKQTIGSKDESGKL